MSAAPPVEFAQIGLDVGHFKKFGNNEWHGPCPICKGNDRFIIYTDRDYPSWNWFCRQCTPDGGWIDDINPRLKENLTPEERAFRASEQAKRAQEDLERAVEKAQKTIEKLRQAQSWLKYYDNLEGEGRRLWIDRGIPEHYQDFWQLGFCENYTLWKTEEGKWIDWWHTPSLSIPVRGYDWQVNNVKHRLIHVPDNGGKYRYEKNGLPATPFICLPEKNTGPLFLAEGEVKSMVVFATINSDKMQVAGLPSATPDMAMLETLKDHEPIYICLDPGANTTNLAIALEQSRVKVIQLPDKIDDLINRYKLGRDWLRSLLRTARRVKK